MRTSVANQKLDIEGEHPAPFPEEIIILPILQTSKEFELVLDPFMGSGTSGTFDKLGRKFVGYDLTSTLKMKILEFLVFITIQRLLF